MTRARQARSASVLKAQPVGEGKCVAPPPQRQPFARFEPADARCGNGRLSIAGKREEQFIIVTCCNGGEAGGFIVA